MNFRFHLLCVLYCFSAIQITSADGIDPKAGFNLTLNQLFDRRTLSYSVGPNTPTTLNYRLFVPVDAKISDNKHNEWPLLVWLHGYNESGDDNESHLRWMTNLFHGYADKRQFPCFVVAYQCPKSHPTWTIDSSSDNPTLAIRKIVDDVLREHAIDAKRIYVAGVSSGGSGCWEMLSAYPDVFAASIVMASGGHGSANLDRIVGIPVWAFHVTDDPDVSVSGIRDTVGRLKAMGGKVWLTETPGHSHDCWTMAAEEFEAVQWLLAQKKGVDGPVPNFVHWGVKFQLIKQDAAAFGLQYYVAAVATGIMCWKVGKRYRRRKTVPVVTVNCESTPAP
jgi:predicted peptidase